MKKDNPNGFESLKRLYWKVSVIQTFIIIVALALMNL